MLPGMLLSVPAAAALLQCNEETLRRHIRSGAVKMIRTAGGQKVDPADLGLPPAACREAMKEWRAALDRAAAAELAR